MNECRNSHCWRGNLVELLAQRVLEGFRRGVRLVGRPVLRCARGEERRARAGDPSGNFPNKVRPVGDLLLAPFISGRLPSLSSLLGRRGRLRRLPPSASIPPPKEPVIAATSQTCSGRTSRSSPSPPPPGLPPAGAPFRQPASQRSAPGSSATAAQLYS